LTYEIRSNYLAMVQIDWRGGAKGDNASFDGESFLTQRPKAHTVCLSQ